MKKRLILHIGMYKTGTSYLQTVFGENRKLLRKQGIYYPRGDFFNHSINFFPIFSNEEKPNAFTIAEFGDKSMQEIIKICKKYWLDEFKAFKKSNAHTFMISAELLCILDLANIKQMKEFVKPYFDEINVVCYVRDPKSLLTSVVQEMVKNGYIRLDGVKKLVDEFIDIEQVIKGYSDVFSENNVFVRPFDKTRLKNNDLISDFVNTIWPAQSIELCLKIDSQNQSLGHYSLLFLSQFNQIYPLHDQDGNVNVGRKPMMFFQDIQQSYDKKINIELPFSKAIVEKLNQQYAFIDKNIDDGCFFEKIQVNNIDNIHYDTNDIPLEFLIHIIKEYEDRLRLHYDIGVKAFTKQKIKKYKNILSKKNNRPTKINE